MNKFFYILCLAFLLFVGGASFTFAATLGVSPNTGVYSTGGTFTLRVVLNTSGASVNAADGVLAFSPNELQVISVNRTGSIFNLWTEEPSFSNAAGTISFGGGSPTGYTGGSGTIMNVTFRTLGSGTPKVTFRSGSVLAADGMGTNVLTNMSGGTYTINAVTTEPAAEPVYVPPANTPGAPGVTSSTHPDEKLWYKATTAQLSWRVPEGVTSVRTLLDTNPGTIPTIVYDEPITSRTLEDLPQGVSYFHIQFKNADGWGRVSHFRLAVDSEKPSSFVISEPEEIDVANPERKLIFSVEDASPVTRYIVQIDGGEPIEFKDDEETGVFTLPSLAPGHHTVIAEAFDSAGNSLISTYSFQIASFEKPIIAEYPLRLSTSVIPVFRGTTRPDSSVTIMIAKTNGEVTTHEVQSGEDGSFTFIPDEKFSLGVYEMTARATDSYGAQSDLSDPVKFIVEEPGYIRVGAFMVSVLSVIIPMLSLILLLVFGVWFVWHRLTRWRKYIIKETKEAENKLASEFAQITKNLEEKVEALQRSRKGKLTKAESELIEQIGNDIKAAGERIRKEISDIDDIVE